LRIQAETITQYTGIGALSTALLVVVTAGLAPEEKKTTDAEAAVMRK